MPRLHQRALFSIGILAWSGATLAFGSPPIRDDVALFKPEALTTAVREIEDIQRQHGLTVRVETVKTYPADQARPATFFGPQVPPDAFFTKWAEERARAAGDADVFVFVCREPVRVRVVVGPKAQSAFPQKASAGLRKLLEQRLDRKAPNFDQGLLDGVAFIRQTLDANLRLEARRQVNWPFIGGVIGVLLVVWLILNLLRDQGTTPRPEPKPVDVAAPEPDLPEHQPQEDAVYQDS